MSAPCRREARPHSSLHPFPYRPHLGPEQEPLRFDSLDRLTTPPAKRFAAFTARNGPICALRRAACSNDVNAVDPAPDGSRRPFCGNERKGMVMPIAEPLLPALDSLPSDNGRWAGIERPYTDADVE